MTAWILIVNMAAGWHWIAFPEPYPTSSACVSGAIEHWKKMAKWRERSKIPMDAEHGPVSICVEVSDEW